MLSALFVLVVILLYYQFFDHDCTNLRIRASMSTNTDINVTARISIVKNCG